MGFAKPGKETGGYSLLPEAPSFDDILRTLLEGAARWLFGSGVIGTAAVTLIALVFVVKTYVDLFNEARRRLPGPVRAVRAVCAQAVELVRGLRLPAALAASAVTIVLCLVQAGWLWGARWQGAMLGELWNIVAWGAWEVHDGTYYTVICVVLLTLAWAGMIIGGWGATMTVPAVAGPLLMTVLSAVFVVVATVIGVVYLALESLGLGGDGTDAWRLAGMYLEYVLLFGGYALVSAVATGGVAVVAERWRRAALSD